MFQCKVQLSSAIQSDISFDEKQLKHSNMKGWKLFKTKVVNTNKLNSLSWPPYY